MLGAGTYRENVLMWKPLRLQGLGPGGTIGTVELQARGPRIRASTSRAPSSTAASSATTRAPGRRRWAGRPLAGVDATHPVLGGADITVVAKTTTAYAARALASARIDGIGLDERPRRGRRRRPAAGVRVNNLQLTNNVLEHNGGVVRRRHRPRAAVLRRPQRERVDAPTTGSIGNGGLTRSGGIGIFDGSNNYEIANSIVCSNFGVEYGAGISHWGLSPGGTIHDNQIYYNDVGRLRRRHRDPERDCPSAAVLGDGSGAVDVDRNLIQSNYSGDDGGGIFVLNALTRRGSTSATT